MSIDNTKKVLENIRSFGFDRFGSMKGLAEAMGIRPQNLNTYLSGQRSLGPKYMARLKTIGFERSIKEVQTFDNTKGVIKTKISADLMGALELTGISIERLAALIGVSVDDLRSFSDGSVVSNETLIQLFNAVVALALVRYQDQKEKAVG